MTNRYRPFFRSQFDYNGQWPNHPNEPVGTVNGKPAKFWWNKNCTFASAAMAMDYHTVGNQKPLPNQLRDVTSVTGPNGSSIQDQRRAWSRAHQINGQWTAQTLEVHASDTWDHFMAKLQNGHGAVVIGYLPAIPGKYRCQPGGGFRGNHAIFVGDRRTDGSLLVFDPLCRPSDKIGNYVDRRALDSHWSWNTQESQPRWIPAEHVRKYAEGWFGRDNRGRPKKPNRVYCGYTKANPEGAGGGENYPTGDVWAAYSPGSWKEEVVPASTPTGVAQMQRTFETGDFWDGYYGQDAIVLATAQQVVSGEEGRVGDWQPTLMGYGVKDVAFYKAVTSDIGVKANATHWYMHPWDIPAEHFWVDPPPWPEGEAFLAEAVEKMNREVGAQALEVVNRSGLWEDIELGGLYSLDLSLQGPHPEGLAGVVRVVAFIPDEDSGTMQLLAEWIEETLPETPHPPEAEPAEEVIAVARSMLGVPYGLGHESLTRTDCSGLVFRAFTNAGYVDLIGSARKSSSGYTKWFRDRNRFTTTQSVAVRGDLIVYAHPGQRVSHMGIYLGNNRVMSALVSTGVTKHNIHAISVPFKGVLRVIYPEVEQLAASQFVLADDEDPETEEDLTESMIEQDEEWTEEADPWA